MSSLSIDEQISYLTKGLADLIREEDLRERLQAGRPLRVKAGFDPTAPDLHLGHTVLIRKMKHFQNLGHTVIFLIGEATALIGDPTGRNITRPPMTRDEIAANAETYKAQVFKLLDPDRTEIRGNAEWFQTFGFEDVVKLCGKYTVARLLEREDFSKRFREGIPISVHELLYPLAQGYDSVALRCDVEMGGTDQLFNLLVGREIQRDYGLPPQIVATVPLLEGTDGIEKMSKSKGNYIGITEPAADMFRKVMNMNDTLIWRYFELLTDLSMDDIDRKRAGDPIVAKKELAKRIVTDFHPAEEAERVAESWGGLPPVEAMEHHAVSDSRLNRVLVQSKLAPSVTEADKLIKVANTVAVFQLPASSEVAVANPAQRLASGSYIVRVGKKYRHVSVEA